jgi:hypothetical protein
MINLFNAQIESLSIHKIGNKSRNEALILSESTCKLNDEFRPLFKEFFFKPFREKEENYYEFSHEVDLSYNEICRCSNELFDHQGTNLHRISQTIAKHLYEQSNHPHIKNGELYVAYIKNVSIDNETVDAIGIFKSELKHDFFDFVNINGNLIPALRSGVLLEKLDKGCLIFNVNKSTGYKILTVDSNRYDSRYWLEHFLSVDICQDENFLTKKYLKFVEGFSKEVILPAEDKMEQINFMNRAVDHFAKIDEFEEREFINETIMNPDLTAEFRNYKEEKGEKYSITDVTAFPVSNKAVSDARKKIKSKIVLDTGVELNVKIVNQQAFDKTIEKGFDPERQQYYYLVYFNKES